MNIRSFTPLQPMSRVRFGLTAREQEAEFLKAGIDGDVPKLQQILDHPVRGFNPNANPNNGMTAFLHSIADRRVDAVAFLKSRPEMDKTAQDYSGQNAFNLAVSDNDNEAFGPQSAVNSYWDFDRLGAQIIDLLANIAGLDVNNCNNEGEAPAHTAAFYGFDNALQALAKVPGFNPNTRNTRFQSTPYHSASYSPKASTRALIAGFPGVDTTLINRDGLTGDALYQQFKSLPIPQWGTGTM